MDFTQVLIQVFILFSVMFLGLFLRQKAIISEEGVRNFSGLIFHITMPAMIIASTGKIGNVTGVVLRQIVIASVLTYILIIGTTFILPKIVRAKEGSVGLYKFMTIFANVGFIGFPMLTVILGEGSVFLGSIFNIPYNVLLYTIGVFYIQSDHKKDHKFELKIKNFLNTGVAATIFALVVIIFKITLPDFVLNLSNTLGSITTPLAMLVVGASLYGVRIKGLFTNFRVIAFSLIRALIFPLIIGLALSMMNIEREVIAVAVILTGMPIATNTVIVARQYDANVLEASESVFISTMLMIITVPYLVYLVNWLS